MGEPQSFLGGRVTLRAGDCAEALREIADRSVDSIVCDPPYALGFMGKKWDVGLVAFSVAFWREAFRVLKAGAHVAAFGGTRSYHRLACAIEDAGFEIRDQVFWIYGSGFPKSQDVAKAIDKALGAEREVVGEKRVSIGRAQRSGNDLVGSIHFETLKSVPITAPASDEAKEWRGWGTGLKPAVEPICLARKPLSEPTVAANVLRWGTGAINVDGCRVEAGRMTGRGGKAAGGQTWNEGNCGLAKGGAARPVQGRWPANVVHDGSPEVMAAFPDTAAAKASNRGLRYSGRHGGLADLGGSLKEGTDGVRGFDDAGGSASRFFYSAKADADDRLGSKHPTIKPVDLMQWLCRLTTPPGGIVLDPFAGTGTTGEAAWREGFRAALIEREPEYCADIARRMALAPESRRARRHESVKARGRAANPSDAPLLAGL